MKPFGWKKPSNHRSWCLPGTSTTSVGQKGGGAGVSNPEDLSSVLETSLW